MAQVEDAVPVLVVCVKTQLRRRQAVVEQNSLLEQGGRMEMVSMKIAIFIIEVWREECEDAERLLVLVLRVKQGIKILITDPWVFPLFLQNSFNGLCRKQSHVRSNVRLTKLLVQE